MPDVRYLEESELQQLAGRPLCLDCLGMIEAARQVTGTLPGAAIVIGPLDELHAGDVVTGRTCCGLDGNRWVWVVVGRMRALDE